MSKVIVLNASYEPLGVVPLHRAMMYIFKERAEIIKVHDGEFLKSASGEAYPKPVAVRFTKMVKVPYLNHEMQWSRRKMLQRDNFSCAYCGKHASTVDHILPQSRGGKNTWMNTVAACMRCNNRKADKTPQEAGMAMLLQPRVVYRQEAIVASMTEMGYDFDSLFATA